MGNHLLLQKSGHIYLLVKYTDRFHIVTVNNKLDESKEEKLLAGNCSEAVLDEMGLTRETIKKSDLRGVAIGGCCAGDILVFHTKDKKRKYVLSEDYRSEEVKAMFAGIERFDPPGKDGAKPSRGDWRMEMQNESMRKIMRPIGIVLNVAGCVSIIAPGVLVRFDIRWVILCLLTIAISLAMYIIFPQYFSMLSSKEYSRAGYNAKVTHLQWAIMIPAVALAQRYYLDFRILNWAPLILMGATIGIAATIIMHLSSREIRENSLWWSALLIAVFISCGIVGQINHYANMDAEQPQVYTVIDTEKESRRRGADRYTCTIELKPGKEMELPIDSSTYRALHPGDTVAVYIGKGALGIEYAYFVDIE